MTTIHNLPDGLSPDSVDTLTELTSIVVKLRAAQAAANGTSSSQTSSSVLPALGITSGATPAPGAVTGTTPLPSGAPNTGGLLSVKELPAATDNLKHKLQRARGAMRTLNDIHRANSQQEEEIKRLEERRRKQAAMLARIQDEGIQFARSAAAEHGDGDRMEE
ncbi:RNA polymerase II transcription mediator complex subunit 9-domain-containing protein [Cladorrhinum samala]|uniref:Mediator of RNA polymerase II transcription subunit 9 n=1 Tax=Cladorrhinum samala TaxID=585594 RepID=A0AAV9HSV8_9PEZI|nr:RNA polymerase II transcription mediator complex subunit 9-domain-containing protein [Cladorrhinum samala]